MILSSRSSPCRLFLSRHYHRVFLEKRSSQLQGARGGARIRQLSASQTHFKRSSSYRRHNYKKQSPASKLMDQWETNNHNSTTNIQRKRFEERQQAFCQAVVNYRNLWFGTPNEKNIATDWRQAMQFQHPMTSDSRKGKHYQQILIESENLFAQICSLCHEQFVAAALLAESGQETNPKQQDSGEFLTAVLPFWESMRKDRASLVKLYHSVGEETLHSVTIPNEVTTSTSSIPNKTRNWVQWIRSMVEGTLSESASSNTEEKLDISAKPINITAHEDQQYAPNHYHYNKLVGRLYFSFPPLISLQQQLPRLESENANKKDNHEKMNILEQRAAHLQRIFDQVPQYKIDSSNNPSTTNIDDQHHTNSAIRSPVLTDKTVRLLIRSYQDIGTLEAAYKTEQIYHRYPEHRKGLLWYVLMSYLQVTQREMNTSSPIHHMQIQQPKKKYSPKSAALATKRVCELLSKQVQKNMNPNEFHSCATIGFQCLANIAVDSIDKYYERVRALAVLKFGSSTWDAILAEDMKTEKIELRPKELRPKDSVSLQLLVQIYAKWDEDKFVERAKSLLDTVWKIFTIDELKDSIERATFHSVLNALDKRRRRHNAQTTMVLDDEEGNGRGGDGSTQETNGEDFQYALGLLDKMMSHEGWYPNDVTFNHLFRLVENGPQADLLFTKLELCRAVTQEYAISPLLASKHALRAWSQTAKNGTNNTGIAMERAVEIFQRLQISSRPLLYHESPEIVSHVYNPQDAPSPIIYSLVWETCYHSGTNTNDSKERKRAVEIAVDLYQSAKDQGLHPLPPKSYQIFLQCLSLSEDEDQQLEFIREIFEIAKGSSKDIAVNPTILEALLDCLVLSTGSDRQQERLELIQDIYNLVVSTHEIPVMTERFLTHLGRLHPKLYEQHIAKHPQDNE